MERYNSDVEYIKQKVLTEVARMCYEKLGEDYAQEIPHMIIPDLEPRYRCCVFKEREIIRQRIRLARGDAPAGNHVVEAINVIKEACHGCPINRFHVTPNCQKCLAKNCVKQCRFGAISMGPATAYIDQSKCRECGKCVTACPYNAIADIQRPCVKTCPVDAIDYDKNQLAVINREKCILCGRCIKDCPFGAINEHSDMAAVINCIVEKQPVAAIVAPALEGQFGSVNMSGIIQAIQQLGFFEVFEAATGADAVANVEAQEILHHKQQGKKTLTSCCPAFYSMVDKHFPTLKGNVSTAVSPMIAVARLIRSQHAHAKIVFISPCVAKKGEIKRSNEVDYVLTFEELAAMFSARQVKLASAESKSKSSIFGRGFALSGGVSKAVKQVLAESNTQQSIQAQAANGATECKTALAILRANRLEADVLEGMMCDGGCIGGCATLVSPAECKKNRVAINNTQNQSILDIVKEQINDVKITTD